MLLRFRPREIRITTLTGSLGRLSPAEFTPVTVNSTVAPAGRLGALDGDSEKFARSFQHGRTVRALAGEAHAG